MKCFGMLALMLATVVKVRPLAPPPHTTAQNPST